MLTLLIPAIGGGAVVLASNLVPSNVDDREEVAPFTVPLPDITQDHWVSFVRHFISPKGSTVTKHFRYGVFEMTVRRLCDLGAMINPRAFRTKPKAPRITPQVVWTAEWVAPLNLRAFLDDTMGQYSLFAESMRRYATEATLHQHVGKQIDGKVSTLSGLLGVAHRGGIAGLQTWIVNPKQRAKFTDTTDAYCRANGLF